MEYTTRASEATAKRPFLCVLDSEKWLHLEGSKKSKLLRGEDGKMCCMGQLAMQIGYDPKLLKEVPAILYLGGLKNFPILERFHSSPTPDVITIYAINDFGYPHNEGPIWRNVPKEDLVKMLNKELAHQGQWFRFALPESKPTFIQNADFGDVG